MIRTIGLWTTLLVVAGLVGACGATPAPPTTTVQSPASPAATAALPTPLAELPTPTPAPLTVKPASSPTVPATAIGARLNPLPTVGVSPASTPEPATLPATGPTATPVPPTSTPAPPTQPATAPAAAPTSAALPAAPLPPTAVPLMGRLIFPVFDPAAGTYNIYVAKVDGSERSLVATAASQPAFNSTGERIAYRSWQGDNRGLFERALTGGDIWKVDTYFEAGRPAFAPDDRSILFQSREAGRKYALYHTGGQGAYEVLRRDGGPIEGEAAAWTPDGQGMVYKSCMGTKCGLFFSRLDGTSPRQLTQDLRDTNPAVSPDGRTVVYMSYHSGNWDIYTMDIDGANTARLTSDPADEGLPTWTADGQTIIFAGQREGEWAIWAMDAAGGNQRRLFALDGSPDGKVAVDTANSFGWLEEQIDWAP